MKKLFSYLGVTGFVALCSRFVVGAEETTQPTFNGRPVGPPYHWSRHGHTLGFREGSSRHWQPAATKTL